MTIEKLFKQYIWVAFLWCVFIVGLSVYLAVQYSPWWLLLLLLL